MASWGFFLRSPFREINGMLWLLAMIKPGFDFVGVVF